MKKDFKTMFKSAQFRKGSYSSLLIIILVAILVAMNFMVMKLPAKINQIDISSNHLYNIGSVTEKLLSGLKSDVKITVVAETGSVDTRISTLLEKYADASKHVKVTYKDPALYPSVLTDYGVEKNTIVVASKDGKKTQSIAFTDIIVTDQQAAAYGYTQETAFDGEGKLTAAINYVSSNSGKIMYTLKGHGETALGTAVKEALTKSNYTVNELSLITDAIPKDCNGILINKPTADLTDEELKALDTYQAAGGNITILLTKTTVKTPNLDKLMAEYGISSINTYIGDSSRAMNGYNSYYVCAPVYSSGSITSSLDSSSYVVAVNAVGLDVKTVEGVTADPFLVTSDKGVKYVDDNTTPVAGKYTYAVAATKPTAASTDKTATDKTSTDKKTSASHLTVFGCGSIIEDDYLAGESALKNTTVFVNAISANFPDSVNVSISPVSLETPQNSFTNTSAISAVTVFVLPLILVFTGVFRWLYRRKL